ncbi:MAG: TIM barrel protein [Armatimonadetes bacterium]|nr:TIM barrel protein [Armatimonadota bacterium]
MKPKLAVNLSLVFTEVPLLERFGAARKAGFDAVEFMFPHKEDVDGIRRALARHELTQVLFNLDVGDFAAGDRGYAVDPAKRETFRQTVDRGIAFAKRLDCRRLNVLVGKTLPGISREEQRQTLVVNLREAAAKTADAGILLLFEPLNRFDAPGYFLQTSAEAFEIVDEIGHPGLKVQYDVYHMQRNEGNLAATIAANVSRIGHIQIADAPDRGQPGTGEINYRYLFRRIAECGYDGYVSAEYRPQGPSDESFGWIQEVLS